MIADLRKLWQEAFGDSEETLDAFFATGFSQDRYNCICEEGVPVSALYWFDCQLNGQKIAYIYAMATAKSHRGRGLARRLLADTHTQLAQRGYAGAILVPATATLFDFYGDLGYRTATTVSEFTATRGDSPAPLKPISLPQYAALRAAYLPANGVVQGEAALAYLHTYAEFYAGEDFLLAATQSDGKLIGHELLGNTAAAPSVLHALSLSDGHFRTVGADKPFSMFLPLKESCPVPAYFGLALD